MSLKIRSKENSTGLFDITLDGRIDSATYKQLETLLEPLLGRATRSIKFDMANVTYMSSMGIRVFLKTAKALQAAGGKMAVVNMQPQIKKVFEIANALTTFSIFESTEEADHYFDLMQKQVLDKQDGH